MSRRLDDLDLVALMIDKVHFGEHTCVGPVDRWLAYLTDIGRSPDTVRAYAFDLKDYWVFLACRGLDWREVRLENIGEFVAWLGLPPAGRPGLVTVLSSAGPQVTASTVNRKLSALAAFYAHQVPPGAGGRGLV